MQCSACNTTNPPGHRFCGECGAALPARSTKPLTRKRGERRQVTVLLADLAGFTALSETLDPEQVTSFVNECFKVLVPVIEEFDGQVDTYIGDAILALFGVPAAHEDDPARAVRCGLLMCQRFAQFLAQHPQFATRVGLHIGINTGLAVTTHAPSSTAGRQFSVMGEVVNLAAQMEQLAEAGEVVVSAATHRFTAPLFRWQERSISGGQGRSQSLKVYRAIEALETSNQVRGIAGLHAPLIGRDHEFAAIAALFRQGGIAAVFGDPGMGKSRLLAELRGLVSSDVTMRWAEGRCLGYGQQADYYPWRDIVCQLCGLHGQDASVLQRQLRERLVALVAQPDDVFAGLSRLLDIGSAGEGEAEGQHKVAQSVLLLLTAIALRQPVVIALDDLHWADPASLHLLDTVASALIPRLLLIGCSRPDGSEGEHSLRQTVATAHGLSLTLQPLTPSDSSELVSALLRVEGMPTRLRQRILERTEGVPFYLEEVIRSLIDSGVIRHEDGGWRADEEIGAIEVPPTLIGVISARLDRLPTRVRSILEMAAVLGRRFSAAALEAMLQADEQTTAHLAPALAELERRELLRELDEGEYNFKHVLTQEVAYNTMLLTERRHYHHAAATYYAALPLTPQPQALADVRPLFDAHYHYVQAQDYAAAYDLTNRLIIQRDGDLPLTLDDALDRWGENSARRTLYLPLAPNLYGRDAAHAWGRLGHAHERLGDLTTALKCYAEAVKLAEDCGDLAAQSTWIGQTGITSLMLGNTHEALDYYRRAWQLAVQIPDRNLQVRWLNAMGNAHRLLGQVSEAIDDYTAALELATELGSRRNQGVQLSNLGLAYSALGQTDKAISYYQQGLDIAREVGDRRTEGLLLGSLALAYTDLNASDTALDYYRQAIAFALLLKERHSVATWLVNMSGAYAQRGEFDNAIAALGQALTHAAEMGSVGLQAESLAGLGYAHQMLGDRDYAYDCYTRALALAQTVEQPELLTIVQNGLARVYAAQGDKQRATSLLTLDLPAHLLTRSQLATCHYNNACTLALLQRNDEARTELERAIALNPCYSQQAEGEHDFAAH